MEIWKSIKGYENLYEVSNLGNVKSLRRAKTMKATVNVYGYYVVNLSKNAKSKVYKIHQLVAMAFLNHKPCGMKLVVNHKDFNKLNNRVDNLEITTQRINGNKLHLNSTSKYIGVSQVKSGKWRADIKINGKQKLIGTFIDEYDAHLAYENELSKINPPI